jgi:hypothetical protein
MISRETHLINDQHARRYVALYFFAYIWRTADRNDAELFERGNCGDNERSQHLSFTIKVTDTLGFTGSQAFQITIAAPSGGGGGGAYTFLG